MKPTFTNHKKSWIWNNKNTHLRPFFEVLLCFFQHISRSQGPRCQAAYVSYYVPATLRQAQVLALPVASGLAWKNRNRVRRSKFSPPVFFLNTKLRWEEKMEGCFVCVFGCWTYLCLMISFQNTFDVGLCFAEHDSVTCFGTSHEQESKYTDIYFVQKKASADWLALSTVMSTGWNLLMPASSQELGGRAQTQATIPTRDSAKMSQNIISKLDSPSSFPFTSATGATKTSMSIFGRLCLRLLHVGSTDREVSMGAVSWLINGLVSVSRCKP